MANWVSRALKESTDRLNKHDPVGYVERNSKKLKEQYGSDIIVVIGKGVLVHGSNLDNIIDNVDLSSDEKIIAGTVDSILNGEELPYVWLRNDYAGTPNDMSRHAYFAEQEAHYGATQAFDSISIGNLNLQIS